VPDASRANNTASTDPFGIGQGPDLVVDAVSGPPNSFGFSPFDATAEVCNRGTLPSNPAWVSLYLSADEVIESTTENPATQDVPAGQFEVPPLSPGECHAATGEGQTADDGTWFLGAIVDESQAEPELVEGNNAHTGPLMGVGYGPDLVVSDLTAPPSAQDGGTFPATIEVCNQGTGPSTPSDVEFVHKLFGMETMVGFHPIPPLEFGECIVQEVWLSPEPGVFGPRRLAAKVDPFDGVAELLEGNNGFDGPIMGVGFGPDLVVSRIEGPPSAQDGSNFDALAEVCNVGTDESPPAGVAFYHSADDLIESAWSNPTSPDPFLGEVPVPPLFPGACAEVDASLFAGGGFPGPVHLAAIVDDAGNVPELFEWNNVHVGPLMGLGYGPDLVVTALAAPPSVPDGSEFIVDSTVCNQGTDASPPLSMTVYFSADDEIFPGLFGPGGPDVPLGEIPVPPLDPGECRDLTSPVWAAAPSEGAWKLGALVDERGDVTELIETNNAFIGPLMGVGFGPDLAVTSIDAPPSVEAWESFDVDATVCNRGTTESGPTGMTFYHSTDATIEGYQANPFTADAHAGELFFPAIQPLTCVSVRGPLYTSVSEDGAFWLGAVVDEYGDVAELIETNNTFIGPVMGIGYGPDLVVRSVLGPPTALQGAGANVAFEVCNQGTAPAGPTEVRFFHDSGSAPPPPGPGGPSHGHFLGEAPVPSLDAGVCHASNAQVWIPSEASGEAPLRAVVDEGDVVSELVESNNLLDGATLGVGSGPDLVVTQITAPPAVLDDAPFDVDAEVCNQGTTPSPPASLALYHSDDAVIESGYMHPFAGDLYVGDLPVPALAVGACFLGSTLAWPEPGTFGELYLGGIVDDGEYLPELIESNNVFTGPLMGVGDGPDLVVSSLVVPASAPQWDPISLEVDVCNPGTGPASASFTNVYLSEDDVVEGSATVDDFLLLSFPVSPLAPGACELHSTSVPLSVPFPGTWRVGVWVDETQLVPELVESNNLRADWVIEVTTPGP
jgi:subtilase family serine protease